MFFFTSRALVFFVTWNINVIFWVHVINRYIVGKKKMNIFCTYHLQGEDEIFGGQQNWLADFLGGLLMNKLFENKWRQTVKMSAYLLTYLLALNHPFHNVSYLAAVFPYTADWCQKMCFRQKQTYCTSSWMPIFLCISIKTFLE